MKPLNIEKLTSDAIEICMGAIHDRGYTMTVTSDLKLSSDISEYINTEYQHYISMYMWIVCGFFIMSPNGIIPITHVLKEF